MHSQHHEADNDDLDDEEQFLNLDDVLEGKMPITASQNHFHASQLWDIAPCT